MKISTKIWICVVAVVVLLGVWGVGTYNNLVVARESVTASWSQVENQFQRRFDLIPNLVESVKGIMKQEQAIFTALAEARTRYSGAGTVSEKAAAAGQVESALARLLVVMENYPQLKSSDAVTTLMAQLEGTENRVAVERGRYNESVMAYNVRVRRFPSSLIAGVAGFGQQTYFEAADGAATAPAVSF